MSIDKDPEFFKLLVGVIAFFAGILNIVGVAFLKYLKSNDEKLFSMVNDISRNLSVLVAEHEIMCKIHERRKNSR
jgi:hypothetical protein